MLGSRRMYKDYPKFPFSPVLMGNNYTGWPSSMKLGSLRSRPLPSSGFRIPKSGLRVPGFGKMRTNSEPRLSPPAAAPPASEFRFPISEVRNADTGIPENRKLASESDDEELMAIGFISGLRGLAKERRIWACNYPL